MGEIIFIGIVILCMVCFYLLLIGLGEITKYGSPFARRMWGKKGTNDD